MAAKRPNEELTGGATPEKYGRLADTSVDQMEPELDDEVAKELREFEQLQSGLLDCTGEQDGVGNEGGMNVGDDTAGQDGGSDMEVDDLEREIAEARRRSAAFQAGERKQARNQQEKERVQQRRPVLEKFQPVTTHYRVLPDNFAEKNLRGDDLIEKTRILDGKGPCLDRQRVMAYEKFRDTRSVDTLGDLQSRLLAPPLVPIDPTFQSQAAAKRVECPTKPTMVSPRKTQLTGMKLQPPDKPVSKETLQSPFLKQPIQSASPQPSTSNGIFHSAPFVPKEAFVDPVLKNPVVSKSSSYQDFRDPMLDSGPNPSLNKSEKALPGKSSAGVKEKHEGRLVRLEPRDNGIRSKRPQQHDVRAMNFEQPAALPNAPIQQTLRNRPIILRNNHPSGMIGSQVSPTKPMVHIPPRTLGESAVSIPPMPSRTPSPNTPKPPKDPAYLDFLEKSKAISRINPLPEAQPTQNSIALKLPPSKVIPKDLPVDYCVIEQVIQSRFNNCFDHEKSKIVGTDRPKIWCPQLYPYMIYYDKVTWLTPCNELKKFFCWPCLCFTSKGIWSLTCDNLEHVFVKELNKHQNSLLHQEAVKQFEVWKLQENTSVVARILEKKQTEGSWTDQQREYFVKRAKPCPILKNIEITFQSNRDRESAFHEFYDRFNWTCGCVNSQKFYCWPCLLFTADNWSYVGAIDSAGQELIQHEISLAHLSSCLKLGKKKFELKKKSESISGEGSNMRYFLESLVEVFCAEKKKINNTELSSVDFVDSLELMSSYNKNLLTFLLEKSNASESGVNKLVASHASPILESVDFFIKREILKEINNSNFVSLIFDHSSGHSNKAILSVIARYVDSRGTVHERFVKLLNVGYNSLTSTLSDEFFQVITELQCRLKLIGYTYDGYLVKPGNIPDFNAKVRKVCPNARFFHYTEHNFLRILKQTLSHMPTCRSVLQVVQELADFLDSTPTATKRLVALIQEAEKRDLGEFWKSADFVKIVYIYHVVIVELMQSICNAASTWKVKTVVEALNFLDFLKDPVNRFFVTLMARIYNTVQDFTAELGREVGIDDLMTTANNTIMKIQKMGRNFENVVESACSHLDAFEERCKLYKEMFGLQEQFSNVIRAVVKLIKHRTTEMESGYFKISKEPGSTNFIELKRQMLVLENAELPMDFNSPRLSTELKFFRSSSLSGLDLSEILAQMNDYNMTQMLPELLKFVQLALTVPKKLYDSSKIPAVKRILSYIKGKRNLNSTDALIWMEKDILTNLQKEPKFYEKVATRVESITSKDPSDQSANKKWTADVKD